MLKWLRNKKNMIIYLVGVLLLSTGVSYAYFRATSSVSGSGSVASGVTATVSSEGVIAGGNISVSEADIYPGHKAIASIKATGTGDNTPLIYNLIFNGTNTFNSDITYKVYKTTTNINASYNCIQEQNVVDGSIHYYETCSGTNIDSLGEVVSSGIITKGETTTKTTLLSDEIILTSEEGTEVYYYVEIEYPNNNTNQNNDIGSSLSGNITVERSENEYNNPSIIFTSSTTAGSNNWYTSASITTSITTETGNYEALYCTTTSSSCTPDTTPNISNNQFSVTLSNNASSQKVCVRVVDEYNQVTEGCSNAYSVDNTNPTASVTLASSTSGSNGWYKSVSIRATGSDAHSGVASIRYCTTTSSSCTPTTSSSGSSATINLSSNASARRVCARAVDRAGNVGSTTCSNTYSVDSTSPTISITSTSATSDSITVNVSASDSHSGIYQYKFSSNNGSSYTTVTSSSSTYSYTFNNLNDDTTYNIAVQVVDRAGNTSSRVTRSVTTDKETKEVDTILGTLKINLDIPDFTKTSCSSGCEETTVGIYETTDYNGSPTYYWRGDVDNNYLVFADKYWRIIRINGDGSIRMIYSGEKATVDAAGKEMVLANGYNDYTTGYTRADSPLYNPEFWTEIYNKSETVGYTFTVGNQRPSDPTSGEDSYIKRSVDNWYIRNNLQNYDNKISISTGFCNDRETTSGRWWSSGSVLHYAPSNRLWLRSNSNPTLACNSLDILPLSAGIITGDEIVYAGGVWGADNNNYYLYTGYSYWTMTPYYYTVIAGSGESYTEVFCMSGNGGLDVTRVTNQMGNRPVINITNVSITGSGTIQDPYVAV